MGPSHKILSEPRPTRPETIRRLREQALGKTVRGIQMQEEPLHVEIHRQMPQPSRRSLLIILAGVFAIPSGLAAAAPENAKARERKSAPFLDQPPVRGQRGRSRIWTRRRQRKGV